MIEALYNLSLPLAYIGLFLALSDLRKWPWLEKAELFVEQIAEKRRSIFGGLSLGYIGLEFIAGFIAIIGYYFWGFQLEGKGYLLVYALALLALIALPFVCYSLKIFGRDRAIGSVGAIQALIGVAIGTAQRCGVGS